MKKPYFVLIETNKIDAFSDKMEAIKTAIRDAVESGNSKHYTVLEVSDELGVNGVAHGVQ